MTVLQSASAIVIASGLLGASGGCRAAAGGAAARLRSSGRSQHQPLRARRQRRGASGASFRHRPAHPDRFSRRQQRRGPVVRARPGRVSWTLRGRPAAVHDSDSRGRVLYGISADATVESRDLQIRQAVLSSVRVLRDYQLLGTQPSAVAATPTGQGARSAGRATGSTGRRGIGWCSKSPMDS